MNNRSFQTVFLGCLLAFSLQCTACSPYQGIQNSAYKAVNDELKNLKKNGTTALEIECGYFADWDSQQESLPKSVQKLYLDTALNSWSVDSITETPEGLEAVVTISTADLDFLDSDALRKDYLPWLTQKAAQLKADNPDLSQEQLEVQLQSLMEDSLKQQLEEAQPKEVVLVFLCSKADGQILSITEQEQQE